MGRVLIVDCYDSFTFNISHYIDELNDGNCHVVRYDLFTAALVSEYSHVIFSPGPGLPADYPVLDEYFNIKPPGQAFLGVCLGHQCLAIHMGAELKQLQHVKHGVVSNILTDNNSILFSGINNPMTVGHYHSWVISENNFPAENLIVSSKTEDGMIMSVEHRNLPLYGVQFHPESVMTASGKQLLKNWLFNSRSF